MMFVRENLGCWLYHLQYSLGNFHGVRCIQVVGATGDEGQLRPRRSSEQLDLLSRHGRTIWHILSPLRMVQKHQSVIFFWFWHIEVSVHSGGISETTLLQGKEEGEELGKVSYLKPMNGTFDIS